MKGHGLSDLRPGVFEPVSTRETLSSDQVQNMPYGAQLHDSKAVRTGTILFPDDSSRIGTGLKREFKG